MFRNRFSRWLLSLPAVGACLIPALASAQSLDLASSRLVDLTHPFNERTVYWPTSPSAFELDTLT